MTLFPINKQLTDYPHIPQSFPLDMTINQIYRHFPAHRHDFLEFSLVIEGSGYEVINGIKHPMQPGTFTFLLPYQIHEIFVTSPQPLRLYNCMFGIDLLQAPMVRMDFRELLFSKEPLPSFMHLDGGELEQMAGMLMQLHQEARSRSGLWRNSLMLAKLTEILVRFDRLRRSGGVAKPKEESGMSSVWPIIRYIHHHYREPISLSGIAGLFRMSSSHLSEEIKKHIGMNFVHFLHRVRISHACGLLASTSMSACDIAEEVGFGSLKSFSRIFRAMKGVTPAEYRKRCHSEEAMGRESVR